MIDQFSDRERVLVVIPTYNEENHIEACIRSLVGSDGLNCEIIVCDGLSTDATKEIVGTLQETLSNLHFLENEKRLQSAAINHAVETYASENTRYVVRCDAHSFYPKNFVADVVQCLEETGAASVVTVMDSVGSTCFEKANAWVVDTPLGSGGAAHRGGAKSGYVDHGHHAGFDVAWFQKVGGYDETFSHNEDAEYVHRLVQSGGKIYLNSDIRIAYTPRGSLPSLARQYFNYGKGRSRTILKHAVRPKVRQLLPVFAFLAMVFGVALLPVAPLFALIPLSYLLILAFVSLALAVSKKSLCASWAGPALGAMHMSWGLGFLVNSVRFGIGHAGRTIWRGRRAKR